MSGKGRTIVVSPQVHTELAKLKLTSGHRTMDSVIRELLMQRKFQKILEVQRGTL